MPRTQINQPQKKHPNKLNNRKLKEQPPINKITIKYLIKIILPYSAKNNKAKPPLPYSILNPETNSDSPSAKSKGVRLVSARQEVTQQIKIGNIITKNQMYF